MVSNMNNINTVIETIKSNQMINNESKNAIMNIINDMYRKGYLIEFEELNNKLANLQIVDGKLKNKTIDYQDGKIIIDSDQAKYYDHKLALTSIIIEMSRKHSDKGEITEPISLGFNESYAIALVGIDGRARYEEEQVISRMLGKMIGEGNLFQIYFNGNMVIDLPKKLLEDGCEEQAVTDLLKMIKENYNMKEIK